MQSITSDAVTLRLTAKVRPGRRAAVQRELRLKVVAVFEDAGIMPPRSESDTAGG